MYSCTTLTVKGWLKVDVMYCPVVQRRETKTYRNGLSNHLLLVIDWKSETIM